MPSVGHKKSIALAPCTNTCFRETNNGLPVVCRNIYLVNQRATNHNNNNNSSSSNTKYNATLSVLFFLLLLTLYNVVIHSQVGTQQYVVTLCGLALDAQ